MKGNGWMQRMLYFVMLMLGIYIVYKGGSLFMKQPAVQTVLDRGNLQRKLENAAARTWTGGYAAVLEGKDQNWRGSWFREALPVYSYLVEHGETESETERITRKEDESGETTAENGLETDGKRHETSVTESGENGAVGARETGESITAEEQKKTAQTVKNATDTEKETAPERNPDTDGQESESFSGTVAGADSEGNTDGKTGGETDGNSDISTEFHTEEPDTNSPAGSEQVREAVGRTISPDLLLELSDFDYLVNEYFTVDGGTVADEDLLNAEAFLAEDLSIIKNPAVPQILIYHTHSQEAFADSVEGDVETTIIGMGNVLADALEKRGYQVIHDTGTYDLVNGVLDRSAAYDYARSAVEELLAEYPTIQVVIDLHRDGVDGQKFVTEIDGKPCSMVMFFNGISRNGQGEISYLPNPYVRQNLAFSFQMELAARQKYPGFTRNIYLKAERFNLHLRPRSVLIEAGTQLNTVEEERNAMGVLAELLDGVLSEKN